MPLIRNKKTGQTIEVADTDLAKYRIGSSAPAAQPAATSEPTRDFMKGGFLSDVGDILSIPQYAATGLLEGKGLIEGVKQTRKPSEALNLKGITGLGADVLLDPLNAASGLGLLGKGAKAVGMVGTANKLGKAANVARKFDPYAEILGKTVVPATNKLMDVLTGTKGMGAAATKSGVGGLSTLVGGKNRFLGQIGEAMQPLSQKLDDVFKAADDAGRTINANEVMSVVDEALKGVPAGNVKAAENYFMKVAEDLFKVIGPEGSVRLGQDEKIKLGKQIGDKFNSILRGKAYRTNVQEAVYFKLREMVESAAPGSKAILEQMEPLMKIKEKVGKTTSRGIDFKGLLAALASIPFGGAPAAAGMYAASDLLKGGKTAISAGRAIQQVSDPLLRTITKASTGMKPSEASIPETDTQVPVTKTIRNKVTGETMTVSENELPNYGIGVSATQPTSGSKMTQEQYDQMVLQDLSTTGGKNLSKLEAAYKVLGPKEPTKQELEKNNLANVIDQMKSLYGVGTDKSLSVGTSTVGLEGALAKGGQTIRKKVTDQNFANNLEMFNQMRALAVGLINQARGAGVLNSGEYDQLVRNMPNEYTSESVAKAWFDNSLNILSKGGTNQNAIIQQVLESQQ